jgi:hypothetical protein
VQQDSDLFYGHFGRHASSLKDLGPYEQLSKAQQAHPHLVKLFDFLEPMLQIAPSARLHEGSIRTALLQLVTDREFKTLNSSPYNNAVWANLRVNRLTTIFKHLRRLATEPARFTQLAAKLTSCELDKLRILIDSVEVSAARSDEESQNTQNSTSESSTPAAAVAQSSAPAAASDESMVLAAAADESTVPAAAAPSSPAATEWYPLAESEPLPRARCLAKQDSEVSVDSSGLPRMFGDAAPAPMLQHSGRKRRLAAVPASLAASPDRAAPAVKAASAAKAAAKAASPKTQAKAQASQPAAAVADAYKAAEQAFDGGKTQWLQSQERRLAIEALSAAQVKRRRFECYRPDLFQRDSDGSWKSSA